MGFIEYLLTCLIVSVGLGVGILLAYISPEELRPGNKYFLYLQKFLFVLILLLILYYFIQNIIILILAAIILGAMIHYLKFDYVFIYPLFAFLLYYFKDNASFFLVSSLLIFLIGFPIGTFALTRKDKRLHVYNIIISLALFVALCLPLYFSNL